jgi:hypothetical protein
MRYHSNQAMLDLLKPVASAKIAISRVCNGGQQRRHCLICRRFATTQVADLYWLAKTNVEGVDVGTISTDLNPASLSQAR